MAVSYDIEQSQNRLKFGKPENHRAGKAPPSDVNLHQGDLLYKNGSNEPVPGSELGATFGSLALAQQAAHDAFYGVCHADYIQSALEPRNDVPTIDDGVNCGYLYQLAAATTAIQDGDFLGVQAVDLGSSNFQITDNTLVKVASADLAIGQARRITSGDSITEVVMVPLSTVRRTGVKSIET